MTLSFISLADTYSVWCIHTDQVSYMLTLNLSHFNRQLIVDFLQHNLFNTINKHLDVSFASGDTRQQLYFQWLEDEFCLKVQTE